MAAVSAPADFTDTPDATVAKMEVLQLLNSGSLDKQVKAVRMIGHYAHTDQFDDDFYRPFITPLQYIVAEGQTDALRIMAVSALYSIGSDSAIRGLRAQVRTLDSEPVAEVAENAVAEYQYDRVGTRY